LVRKFSPHTGSQHSCILSFAAGIFLGTCFSKVNICFWKECKLQDFFFSLEFQQTAFKKHIHFFGLPFQGKKRAFKYEGNAQQHKI